MSQQAMISEGEASPIDLQVQPIVADLLVAEPVWRGVEVSGHSSDGVDIGLLGALTQAGELEVVKHPLTESRGRAMVVSHDGEENALARDNVTKTRR